MTQLTPEHFELHDKNKSEQYEKQKIKLLEDRITTVEKTQDQLVKQMIKKGFIEKESDLVNLHLQIKKDKK